MLTLPLLGRRFGLSTNLKTLCALGGAFVYGMVYRKLPH
jgi:hypothetical protein